MKKILIGQSERVLGTVGVSPQGDWVFSPQDATQDELRQALDVVYARVKRRKHRLTPAEFVRLFYARRGAPAAASATGAWGKAWMAPEVQTLLSRLMPTTDPYRSALRQRDAELLADPFLLKQA